MKNASIRTKILAGVVIVNLLGMITIMVYLHQSYGGSVDVHAQDAVALGESSWGQLEQIAADEFGTPMTPEGAAEYATAMKELTGAEYGILIDKQSLDQAEYEAALEAANEPSNWDERSTYVLMGASDEAAAEDMQLETTPDTIPEMGKIIGIENGACSKTCHGSVSGEGDFWGVRWSDDSSSRAHTVFPIASEGKVVGVAYAIEDISQAANAAKSSMLRTMLVIVLGLLAATIVIAVMLNRLVFSRLNHMISTMEDISMRVAGGDFDAHYTPDGTDDEIGKFEQFFARFMDLISGTLKSLVK